MEREHEKYEHLIARCKSFAAPGPFAPCRRSARMHSLACAPDDKSDSAGRAHDRA